jgi:hypothetical protein
MATVRDVCERALRRIRVASSTDPIAPEDAAIARDVLNSMLASWPRQGVLPLYSALALSAQFRFFVPPDDAAAGVIDAVTFRGNWDASTNMPSLSSSHGALGHVYMVSVAGSTTLDGISSWSVGDYLIFDSCHWLKGISSSEFDRAVIDLLALELCDEFGKEPTATLVRAAQNAWTMIQAAYIKPPLAGFDRAIRDTSIRTGIEDILQ